MRSDRITAKRNRNGKSYKFRRALAGALLIIVLILLMMPAQVDTSFDRSLIRSSVDSAAEEPVLKAEAAEIYSLDLDQPVYQKNADKKIDPYSITKILTCYLVLENLDLSRKIKITDDKYKDYVDGSHAMLIKGELISAEDLLRATMLSSANDAAYFLAVEVAGSEKKFADMMNEQVAAWGLENTHFVNSNGWKHKDHYTTAHDMAVIAARCFENEALRELADTRNYKIAETPFSEERDYENYFWRAVDGVDNIICGKTGSWEEDDCSIALEFKENNLSAVMVLLRDSMKKRIDDIKKLKEYSHKTTPGFIVASEGDVVCRARVKGAAEPDLDLVIDKTIYAYPASADDKDIEVTVNADGIEAPVSAGTPVGSYSVTVDGKELERGELLAAENAEKGWLLSRFYISNNDTLLGASVLLLATCLMLILSASTRRL